MTKFFSELTRRNVVRAIIGYVVVGWLILQVTDVLTGILELPAWPSQLVLLTLVVGLPLVAIISWVYELTPDGFRRQSDLDSAGDQGSWLTARKVDRAIIGVLALAVAVLIANAYLLPEIAEDNDVQATASVAVLPFVNMSSDPEVEFFSDGLSEELLNVLAQVRDFRVPGRTSSFAFKNRDIDLREVGDLLDVDHVLEGSVRIQGNTLRVTAQLNSVEDGYHIWSNTYDRKRDDIFAIQDEIATNVARTLRGMLLDEDVVVISKRGTENVDAYQHFLRGLHYDELGTPQGSQEALGEFRKATLQDPQYAAAWAGQAQAYADLARRGGMNNEEAIENARIALDKALQLRQDDYFVQYTKGIFATTREERIAAFERAIELNPNDPDAYVSLAWAQDDFIDGSDRRLAIIRQAYELDPLSTGIVRQYSIQLANLGNVTEALAILSRLREFDAEGIGIYDTRTRLLEQSGRLADSSIELLAAHQKFPDVAWPLQWLAKHHIVWGDLEAAAQLLVRSSELGGYERLQTMYEASLASRRNDPEEAIEIVRGQYADDTSASLFFRMHNALAIGNPNLAAIHADAYFEKYPNATYWDSHAAAAVAYHKSGRTDDAAARARWLIEQSNLAESKGLIHWVWPGMRATAHAVLGNSDAAIKELELAIEIGYAGLSQPGSYHALPHMEIFYGMLSDHPDYPRLRRIVDARISAARQQYEGTATK